MKYYLSVLGLILLPLFGVSVAQVFAADCVPATPGLKSMHQAKITLLNDEGKPLELIVRVADDAYERAAGFQHICPSVIDQTLILFLYPASIEGQFHMQNVHAPLDIVFFDSRGNFLKYQKMETYTETSRPLYGPGKPFQYALEAPVGFFADNNVTGYPSRLMGNR
ncbi:MAG: DUF192 domain-containing protein [Acidiferrobacterales bacterium]|nr:DUF192 domain-containing protein [Acidiferrobacterales bacterium]